MIITGDCLDVLPTLEANSIDSIVTDPPYGLKFMGKSWDHGVPGVPFWEAALRVAKPGAFMLAFGGTRTFHRLAVAIEDAGWEIRDTIMWVYGSGFPKSLDVSKAIDKAAGAQREVVGKTKTNTRMQGGNFSGERDDKKGGIVDVLGSPATDAARQWEGWGTALKPAVEYIVCAQKPLTLHQLCATMAQNIGGAICQLPSLVKRAESSSMSNPNEYGGESSSVLWSAVEKCNTLADLYDLTDTLPSGLEIPSSLSTGLSWLESLNVLLQAMSTFTTEMESSLKMDLKTLNSLSSMSTVESIIRELTEEHGTGSNASLAESIFNVVNAKLSNILMPSAPGLVTSPDGSSALRPNWRPIIVARKPIVGTVADNVLKYGTGGVNIDGCRVKVDPVADASQLRTMNRSEKSEKNGWGMNQNGSDKPEVVSAKGRWPANLIHDGSEEVLELFPQSAGQQGDLLNHAKERQSPNGCFGKMSPAVDHLKRKDSGSAARFFYCAKASKSDRNLGLDNIRTVKYNIPKIGGVLCKDVSMALVELLQRVTSESTVTWLIGESGESIMGLCQQDFLSTTLTEISKITTSQILPSLMSLLTNGYTLDVKCGMVNGGNPAESVETFIPLNQDITKGESGLARGVSHAVSEMLLVISNGANWKQATNTHSTVKPTPLMRYLCRLVTPPGGVILDMFCGSGSTGKGAKLESFDFIGIDLDKDSCNIAECRINFVQPLLEGLI